MRFAQNLILLPVAVQVLLTVVILVLMAVTRGRHVAASGKSLQDMALAEPTDWDSTSRAVANNFRNQFEIPILFYVACGFALAMRSVDAWMLGLAFVFVLSRIAHAAVHISINNIAARGSVWLVGVGAVIAMWVLLVWRVIEAEL